MITKHKFILTSTELCLSFTKVKTYDNNNNWQTFKRVDLKKIKTKHKFPNRNNEFHWIHFYRSNVMLMFIYLLCYDCHNVTHIVWHSSSVFIIQPPLAGIFPLISKSHWYFCFFSYLCTKFPVLSDHLHCSSNFLTNILVSTIAKWPENLINSCHNDLLFMACSEARWRFHDY